MPTLAFYLRVAEQIELHDGENLDEVRTRFTAEQLLQPVTASIRIVTAGSSKLLQVRLLDPSEHELAYFARSLPGVTQEQIETFFKEIRQINLDFNSSHEEGAS